MLMRSVGTYGLTVKLEVGLFNYNSINSCDNFNNFHNLQVEVARLQSNLFYGTVELVELTKLSKFDWPKMCILLCNL